MKKLIKPFIFGALICSGVAFAATSFNALQATFPILINGSKWTTDKPVVVIDGSTYLPLRAMAEVLGVGINWNEGKRQVEVDANKTVMEVDESRITDANGFEILNIQELDNDNYLLGCVTKKYYYTGFDYDSEEKFDSMPVRISINGDKFYYSDYEMEAPDTYILKYAASEYKEIELNKDILIYTDIYDGVKKAIGTVQDLYDIMSNGNGEFDLVEPEDSSYNFKIRDGYFDFVLDDEEKVIEIEYSPESYLGV